MSQTEVVITQPNIARSVIWYRPNSAPVGSPPLQGWMIDDFDREAGKPVSIDPVFQDLNFNEISDITIVSAPAPDAPDTEFELRVLRAPNGDIVHGVYSVNEDGELEVSFFNQDGSPYLGDASLLEDIEDAGRGTVTGTTEHCWDKIGPNTYVPLVMVSTLTAGVLSNINYVTTAGVAYSPVGTVVFEQPKPQVKPMHRHIGGTGSTVVDEAATWNLADYPNASAVSISVSRGRGGSVVMVGTEAGALSLYRGDLESFGSLGQGPIAGQLNIVALQSAKCAVSWTEEIPPTFITDQQSIIDAISAIDAAVENTLTGV